MLLTGLAFITLFEELINFMNKINEIKEKNKIFEELLISWTEIFEIFKSEIEGLKNESVLDLVTKITFMIIIWKSEKYKILSYNKKINLLNMNYNKSN